MSQTSPPVFELLTSRQFLAWLHEQQASLALSTYQAGKLFLIGVNRSGEMLLFNRTFNRCMVTGYWILVMDILVMSIVSGVVLSAFAFATVTPEGLSFVGDFAVVGLSGPRHNKTFSGLALDQHLADKKAKPRCGLLTFNLMKCMYVVM